MSASSQLPVCVWVEGHAVPWPQGDSLFTALMGAGLPVQSACSGRGQCGLCMVRVTGAPVPAPTVAELQLIDGLQLQQGARLACCLAQPKPYLVRFLSQANLLATAVQPL